MDPQTRSLQRHQIDRDLKPLRRAQPERPLRGWIRTIRDAIGMNGRQLAKRMKISRSHLSQVEDAETRGVISLGTLERAAEGLDCDLVYALVPRGGKTLEELVHSRARRLAEQMVERVAVTMALEDQAVSREFIKQEIDRITGDLIRTMNKDIWNK